MIKSFSFKFPDLFLFIYLFILQMKEKIQMDVKSIKGAVKTSTRMSKSLSECRKIIGIGKILKDEGMFSITVSMI